MLRAWRRRSGTLVPREVVAPPVDFDAFRQRDVASCPSFVKGRIVFVFDWVHAGSGGMSDLVHLGETLRRNHQFDVQYCIESRQTRETIVQSLRFVEPGLRDDQILFQIDEPPEILIAGVWTAAYRCLGVPAARRIFFAQDYDAMFHPAGLIAHFAKSACDLPLDILTLGPWLAQHIRSLHPGARAHALPFPMTDAPDRTTTTRRRYVAIYLQPQKLHRGAPLLIEAARRLQPVLAAEHPDLEIVFFGSADNGYADVGFPCRSLGVIPESAIRQLCRESAVGVSCSFTNISLLPFRFPAHGARAIELDLPHIHANVPAGLKTAMEFYSPHPEALLQAILRALRKPRFSDADWEGIENAYAENSWPACAGLLASELRAGALGAGREKP